jgi:hypothetical protein
MSITDWRDLVGKYRSVTEQTRAEAPEDAKIVAQAIISHKQHWIRYHELNGNSSNGLKEEVRQWQSALDDVEGKRPGEESWKQLHDLLAETKVKPDLITTHGFSNLAASLPD